MLIGYARVSTKSQHIDRQIEALTNAGAKKIFQEKKSGTSFRDREELQKALNFVREDDTLIIDSLERLGRNYHEIVKTIQQLDDKKVGLNVLNLPILKQDIHDKLLQQLIRNLIIQIMSWVAQSENEERKRKQQQGIAIARAKGRFKGKQTKYTLNHIHVKHAIELREYTDKTVQEICEITGLSESTFYRRWREYQSKKSNNI